MAAQENSPILAESTLQLKKNFIWNIAGSTIYALASILLVSQVQRSIGESASNDFAFAFTLAQMFLTIGYFEVRPFQVTDVSGKYGFSDYFSFRLLTSGLMLLCSVVYLLFTGGSGQRMSLILLLCCFKMTDGLADVFEGAFQKRGRMDLSGKSVSFRTLFSGISFVLLLIITQNVLLSSLGLFLTGCLGVFFWDMLPIRAFEKPVRPSFCKKKIRELFQETAFLALGAFLCIYIFQAARLEVDRSMPAYNYIFTALFMPTSFINLVSGFLFKPMLTTLTMTYHQKKLRRFSVWMLGLLGGVALLTLVCLAGAWLLGIPVLSAIYAVDLTDYTQDLLWLILGGGLNAGGILLYYGLTVMRRQKAIFGVYVIVALTALGLPRLLMRFKGFLGASLSYTALMFLQVILFGIVLLWELKKAAGKAGEKANDE